MSISDKLKPEVIIELNKITYDLKNHLHSWKNSGWSGQEYHSGYHEGQTRYSHNFEKNFAKKQKKEARLSDNGDFENSVFFLLCDAIEKAVDGFASAKQQSLIKKYQTDAKAILQHRMGMCNAEAENFIKDVSAGAKVDLNQDSRFQHFRHKQAAQGAAR